MAGILSDKKLPRRHSQYFLFDSSHSGSGLLWQGRIPATICSPEVQGSVLVHTCISSDLAKASVQDCCSRPLRRAPI